MACAGEGSEAAAAFEADAAADALACRRERSCMGMLARVRGTARMDGVGTCGCFALYGPEGQALSILNLLQLLLRRQRRQTHVRTRISHLKMNSGLFWPEQWTMSD